LFSLATADKAVVDVAASTAPLAVVTLVPIVLSLNIAGVLRASGDNVTVMVASLVADYAVLVPLAWFLGLVLGWGLTGIYVAWLGFGLAMLVITGWRYSTGRWRTRII
jgi:multidrug resistance protein, MATE family